MEMVSDDNLVVNWRTGFTNCSNLDLDPPSHGKVVSSWMLPMFHLQRVTGWRSVHDRHEQQDLLCPGLSSVSAIS